MSGFGDLTHLNFTGGLPTSSDLAPSLVFLVCYIISAPILVWRLIKGDKLILLRPTLFLLARLGTFILRAIMSKNNYNENEAIAELVMVSIGTLILIEPCVELWRRNVSTAVMMNQAPRYVQRLALVLKVGVLAAIITAIVGSAQISSALKDPSKLSTVMDLRKASAIITLVVCVILLAATAFTHQHFGLAIRNTLFLVCTTVCLLVVSLYRVIQVCNTNPTATITKPVLFYVLQITFELFTYAALLVIRIPDWFPSEKSQEKAAAMDGQANGGRRVYRPNYAGNAENGQQYAAKTGTGYPPKYQG